VLSALRFALSLESLLPGFVRPRRVIPVVRYDHVREPRARLHLRWLAGRLLQADVDETIATTFTDARSLISRSAGASTGARTVLFVGG
jgi:hypothetical protein